MTQRLIETWLPMDENTSVSLAIEALECEAQSGIEEILASVKKLPADIKSTHLLTILERLRADGYPQVMVFTQFTDTLDFLRDHVAATGQRVMCFSGRGGERRDTSGTWRTIPRDEVKRIFRNGDADILLCTDAAAEGLNFQFYGAIVFLVLGIDRNHGVPMHVVRNLGFHWLPRHLPYGSRVRREMSLCKDCVTRM